MAVRKQRATTSETYAIDTDYSKVLMKAKRIHRNEGVFYIGIVLSSYVSYSEADLKVYPSAEINEKWTFNNNRWVKKN